jgi:hypothetical protein
MPIKDKIIISKPELIKINISTPFLVRTRCVECGSSPTYYLQLKKPFLFAEVQLYLIYSKFYRSYIQRMTENWYLYEKPKHFISIKEFSFILDDKHYVPKFFHTRGFPIGRENRVEFLSCSCGATLWAFNQKSVKNRPEIVNRKGRYSYPNKFEY